jgi:hypothetical protein
MNTITFGNESEIEKVILDLKYYNGHLCAPEWDEYLYSPDSINKYFNNNGVLRPYFDETSSTKMLFRLLNILKRIKSNFLILKTLCSDFFCLLVMITILFIMTTKIFRIPGRILLKILLLFYLPQVTFPM